MVELLKRIGWTQGEFGRQIGASKTTVGKWCGGGYDSLAYRLAMLYLNLLVERMGK